MCEITEDESMDRRLDSLAAENERLLLAVAVEQSRAEDALESLATEVLRLRAEVERLECGVAFGVLEQLRERAGLAERERDRLLDSFINLGTREDVRRFFGLDAAPPGEKGDM
jgi:hypothetical protein